MITATLLGRLQTKALTYPLLAVLTAGFVVLGGDAYLWAFALMMIIGMGLETLWGLVVWYQPGWLTLLFGLIEFLAILTAGIFFAVSLSVAQASVYYSITWIIIQLFLIYLLPVFRTCWAEYGGEIW